MLGTLNNRCRIVLGMQHGCTDACKNASMDAWMYGCVYVHRHAHMHARMDGWMDGGRTGWLGWLAVWVGGWVDADGRWLGGWVGINGWMAVYVFSLSYHSKPYMQRKLHKIRFSALQKLQKPVKPCKATSINLKTLQIQKKQALSPKRQVYGALKEAANHKCRCPKGRCKTMGTLNRAPSTHPDPYVFPERI